MQFRTEIIVPRPPFSISHDDSILMLGSCFSDNIGALMERDGFHISHNPMGPLYNPLSIARTLSRSLDQNAYSEADLIRGPRGYHCLDFASRYSGEDLTLLLDNLNRDFLSLSLVERSVMVFTFGSAFIFEHKEHGLVGNCHKLPSDVFNRRCLTVDEIVDTWIPVVDALPAGKVVFTVSPIRHLADGLHGNQLSKATLLLAIDEIVRRCPKAVYFPAYEILIDDLRDYRFYASDMKHPSEVAEEYIYEHFSKAYFNKTTLSRALDERKKTLASCHRTILS